MQIDALMADRHRACNLLGAPLNPKEERHIGPDLGSTRRALRLRWARSEALAQACSARYPRWPRLRLSSRLMVPAAPAQQSGNLADGLFGFQEAVNLASFFSAEVLVHLATWTWRFE